MGNLTLKDDPYARVDMAACGYLQVVTVGEGLQQPSDNNN